MNIANTNIQQLVNILCHSKNKSTATEKAVTQVPISAICGTGANNTISNIAAANFPPGISIVVGYCKDGEIIYNTTTKQTEVAKPEIPDSNDSQKKYTGSLTASQLLEKYTNGEKLSDEEYDYMLFETNGNVFDAASLKRNIMLDEKNISKVLAKNNIELAPDQELHISIDCQNKITISGIADSEKCEQIANDLSNEARNLAAFFRLISETYKNVSDKFKGNAERIGTVENYLAEQTGGSVSITDLTLQGEKIIGLTPELDHLLNRDITDADCYYSSDEADNFRMKYSIIRSIEYLQNNESDNIPQMNFTLSYKNGKLSCIEQPDLVEQHPKVNQDS